MSGLDTYQRLQLLASVPEVVVWLIGAGLCLKWSRRSPGSATLIGLGVMIALTRRLATAFVPEITALLELLFAAPESRMLALYLAFSVSNAAAWGCALVAVGREMNRELRDRASSAG